MDGERCELCGEVSQLWALETHHIVSEELTSQAGMSDSVSVTLCSNCHRELHLWYCRRVSDMTYDTMAKRFRSKSLVEMVREYEVTYRVFAEYKKEQQNRT